MAKTIISKMGKRVRLVLIDLSGTLHIEDEPTPGAVDALKRLQQSSLSLRFVTNTTKESRARLHGRLTKIGFTVRPEDILSSLWAARELVERRGLRPLLLLDAQAEEDFAGLGAPGEDEADSVLVGLAPDKFNYEELNTAFRVLNKGGPLIAIHQGRYYKRSDGLALGPGPFVKGLEYATNVKPEVVGKPTELFFRTALGGVPADEAVMIGDDVRDDIDGAQQVGIRGYLVQTGKYRPGDETTINPPPHSVVPSFAEAVEKILAEAAAS
ncbi:haloacid dehalogenase-like hydrolase domain-containing protein 2 isoform X1 [Schistocerca nitens]|uniref:haloacid dehalogenase-like hydrolase domain-containing protein 2 isoform X1 n=1 Tax=Schistocerca nitens TaxID=7011 RepID=UPI0021175C51|nr:haloacid dehalogenase-like hydrolase domain-containing protein 2 isoform X1 [Schistocerca nitens]